jgi:uncharacterized protein
MGLEINVAQLLKAPVGTQRDYELSGDVDIEGCQSMAEGQVDLVRTDRSILTRAVFQLAVEATCSRCLGTYRCPLHLKFEEEYFPLADVVNGRILPVPEDSGFTIDEHNILDLSEAIRQYALLAVPMKPLCSPECAGLCANCGQDLNRGACNCQTR